MKVTLDHAGASRAARSVVESCCTEAATGPVCQETAGLLTSELVTNALLHGSGRIRLAVQAGAVTVRVEVGDDEPRHPELPEQVGGAESGRGILLVDGLASAWGVRDGDPGKTVWFELGAQP
jgi:anti-sigma regulatory factor (Ser/Thr protein kinase)